MKTLLAIVVGAFVAVVLAWIGLVLWHKGAGLDEAFNVVAVAFVVGGLGGALCRWTIARSPASVRSSTKR